MLAKAGIQYILNFNNFKNWIPVPAGMPAFAPIKAQSPRGEGVSRRLMARPLHLLPRTRFQGVPQPVGHHVDAGHQEHQG